MSIYSVEDKKRLLAVARKTIEHSLEKRQVYALPKDRVSDKLLEHRASFVTLKINKSLRGCIGSLEATRTLIEDVSHNAHAAAFKDTRFNPMNTSEFKDVDIHIYVLSKPEPMEVSSEVDLLKSIRPHIDGLVLKEQGRRATFLPSVWEQIPDPKEFLVALKQKAGFTENYWSSTICFERYSTELIK